MLDFFYLFLAGIVGGFIAGLVGVGGGVVYVFIIPIALKFLGVPIDEIPQFTIANSIFAILFASGAANYVNIRSGKFFKREIAIIGIFGVGASLLILEFVVNTTWYSIVVFNFILILLLLFILLNTLLSAKKIFSKALLSLKKWQLGLVGVLGGGISALSGLGGGTIIIPVLNTIFRVDIKKASAISLGVITIMTFCMTVFNLMEQPIIPFSYDYAIGYIVFPVSLSLSLGVVLSSPVGVWLARKVPAYYISYFYAFFLIIVILKKVVEFIQYI